MDEDILVQSLHTYIGISIKRKIYRSCQRLFYLQVYHILALFHFFYFILGSQFVQSLDNQFSLARIFVVYAVCYLFVIVYFRIFLIHKSENESSDTLQFVLLFL